MYFGLLFERILSIMGWGMEAGVPSVVEEFVAVVSYVQQTEMDAGAHLAFACSSFYLVQDLSSWDSATHTLPPKSIFSGDAVTDILKGVTQEFQ